MSKQLPTERREHWVVIASHELLRIQNRWGLASRRQLSMTLHINPRTLAKLNHRCPDRTLRVETLLRIYNCFMALVPIAVSPGRRSEEERLITESLLKVLRHIAPIPQALFHEMLSYGIGKQKVLP